MDTRRDVWSEREMESLINNVSMYKVRKRSMAAGSSVPFAVIQESLILCVWLCLFVFVSRAGHSVWCQKHHSLPSPEERNLGPYQ